MTVCLRDSVAARTKGFVNAVNAVNAVNYLAKRRQRLLN
jgi:hypothetical protein